MTSLREVSLPVSWIEIGRAHGIFFWIPVFCRASNLRPAFYVLSVLREAFKILSDAPDPEEAFLQLDKTDWTYSKPLSPSSSPRAKRQNMENVTVPALLSLEKIRSVPSISNMLLWKEGEHRRHSPTRQLVAKPLVTLEVQSSECEESHPSAPPSGSRYGVRAPFGALLGEVAELQSWKYRH